MRAVPGVIDDLQRQPGVTIGGGLADRQWHEAVLSPPDQQQRQPAIEFSEQGRCGGTFGLRAMLMLIARSDRAAVARRAGAAISCSSSRSPAIERR